MSVRKINWDKQPVTYFKELVRYIRKDSPKNAEKVKKDILRSIKDLVQKPEVHPPDKFRKNNKGNYRAFELHRIRIAYRVKENEIIIVRMRHTSQEPLKY
jgi:plasmid stabilization system protein ParE